MAQLKSIEKANKVLQDVKTLDKEINNLQKLQQTMFDNEQSCEIKIKPIEKPSESVLSELRYEATEDYEDVLKRIRATFSNTPTGVFGSRISSEKVQNGSIEINLNMLGGIKLINTVLVLKVEQRKELLTKLSEMGFEI